MAPDLPRLIQALTEDEKQILRDSMGIDVDAWAVNERGVKKFESQLADYRKVVTESPPPTAEELKRWERQAKQCVSCGMIDKSAELYVTLKDSTTVCLECLEHLRRKVRLGGR